MLDEPRLGIIPSSASAPSTRSISTWWRRGELNPRPEKSHYSFYARVSFLSLAVPAANEQATVTASIHIEYRSPGRLLALRSDLLSSPNTA
jgi:hypothetical protein